MRDLDEGLMFLLKVAGSILLLLALTFTILKATEVAANFKSAGKPQVVVAPVASAIVQVTPAVVEQPTVYVEIGDGGQGTVIQIGSVRNYGTVIQGGRVVQYGDVQNFETTIITGDGGRP
jgi:hypothetical protein